MFSRLNSLPNHRTLLEFRAGKMSMIGRMVYPDTRKGLVYLIETDDNLIHFCWKDRISGITEDDLIIFPDDFEFKRVNQCTTGRVYVLISKSTPQRNFFWLQEPKTDRDNEFCYRVNEIMNGSPFSRNGNRDGNRNLDAGDINYVLNNMTPQQLIQLFTQLGRIEQQHTNPNLNQPLSIQSTESSKREIMTPTTTDDNSWPSTTTSKRSSGSTSTSSSRQSRKSISTSKRKANGSKKSLEKIQEIESSGNAINLLKENNKNINFSMILVNSEAIQRILTVSNIEKLESYLPKLNGLESSNDVKQKIKDTLLSPDYQETLREFSLLLESGNLGSVVKESYFNPEVMKILPSGNIELFLKALELKGKDPQNKL